MIRERNNDAGKWKRYNSVSEYFRMKFGGRIQKLAIDAGFTCPNRDGTIGKGGCSYCENNAFNPSYCTPGKSVSQQLAEGIEFHKVRYNRAVGYMAYFQAYTNTYSSLPRLRELYEEALSHPEIRGLVIGTRPDCVDADALGYLSELNRKTFLVIEYGIETAHNKTLEAINRGHTYETAAEMVQKTSSMGIRTGAHLIIGLPGEMNSEIKETILKISGLPLDTLKFHQLQIVKGTRMAAEYNNNPGAFRLFSLEEYLELITDRVSILHPDFLIDRIAGEVPPAYNLAPSWGMRYDRILQEFEKMPASVF